MVEIKFGAGGDDSKLFVADLEAMYRKYSENKGFQTEIILSEFGYSILKVSGKKIWPAFKHEAGKVCLQRVPPTERSGRRQTSMLSVAVLPLPPVFNKQDQLPDKELEIKFQCGKQGAGGMNVNSVASAVRMKHIPTGLSVFINGRDQGVNKREALKILTARVNEHHKERQQAAYGVKRKDQLGDGGRGDKSRTYNFIDFFVVDHRLGKESRMLKQVMKGDLSFLTS